MKSKNQSYYNQIVGVLEIEILEMEFLLAIINTGMTSGDSHGSGAADRIEGEIIGSEEVKN